MQEKREKKDLHTAREDRGAGRYTKDLCSFWNIPFSSAEGQLFPGCLSHIWTDCIQWEVHWKGLAEYLYFTVLTHCIKEFPGVPFFDTEKIFFLTFTGSIFAGRRVKIPTPAPLFTSILAANMGPNTLNSQWFLHCRELLWDKDRSFLVSGQGKAELELDCL